MNLSRFLRITAAVVVVQLVLAAWGLTQVPLDAQVPIHWGPSGEADGFASPLFAFLLIPAVTVVMAALLAVIPRVEPRGDNLRRSADAYRTVAVGLVLFFLAIQVFIVLAGVGIQLPVSLFFGAGVGLLFMVMGNVMGTVRPNYMFGVRTPWTLTSDLSWDRTHRLVGRLFVLGGLAVVLVSLLGQDLLVFAVLMVVVVVVLVVAFWYSYRVWKTDPDRRERGTMG